MSKCFVAALVAQTVSVIEAVQSHFSRYEMSSDMADHHFGVKDVMAHEKQHGGFRRFQPKLGMSKSTIGDRLTKTFKAQLESPSEQPIVMRRTDDSSTGLDYFTVKDVLSAEENETRPNARVGHQIAQNLYGRERRSEFPNHHFGVKDVMRHADANRYTGPTEMSMEQVGDVLTQLRSGLYTIPEQESP